MTPSRVRPSSTSWTCPPRMPHRQEVLRARLGPLHRTADLLHDARDDRVLHVHPDLRAEAATHGRYDHVDGGGLDAEHSGESVTQHVRHLRRDRHLEPAVLARDHDHPVGLHGNRSHAWVREPRPYHDLRVLERVGFAAEGHLHRDVAPMIGEEQRGIGCECGHRINDRAQRVVVDDDHLRRVDCLGPSLGDDDRHSLADETHPLLREELAAEGRRHHGNTQERSQAQIDVGVHAHDPRERRRLRRVDAFDPRVARSETGRTRRGADRGSRDRRSTERDR